MVYDPDIPQPKDDISVSQGELLANFQGLNTQFSINHVALDDTTGDAGKHKFVTFVQQPGVPETKGDEYLIVAQDDAGTPELFARPQSNAPSFQLTKAGFIYGGLIPEVAVNWDQTGVIQGSSLNVASVTRPGGSGTYLVTFTNALPDNNYFWSVSGFDNSNNPVISAVSQNASYAAVVKAESIQFDFRNQNNTKISGLIRACCICWRVQ